MPSTIFQLQIHPSLPALHCWSWILSIFPAGTKLSFVSKGHWRRKRFALLVPMFGFFFGQAPAVGTVVFAVPIAQHACSTYPRAGNKAAELPPAHSGSQLKVQRRDMSSTKDGFSWTSEGKCPSPTTTVSQWASLYLLTQGHALSYKDWISATPGGRLVILECSVSAPGFVAALCLLFLYFSEFSSSD